MWLSEEGIAFATNRTLRTLGVNEGKYSIAFDSAKSIDGMLVQGNWVKCSELSPTMAQLTGAKIYMDISAMSIKGEETLTSDFMFPYGEGAFMIGEEMFLVVNTATAELEAGTYYNNFLFPADGSGWEFAISWETTTPIDPKYLPGVCLSLVELSALPESDPITLTAEESAVLDKVAVSCLPIVVKVSKMAGVFDWANEGGADMFVSNPTLGSLALLRTDSLWTFHRLG